MLYAIFLYGCFAVGYKLRQRVLSSDDGMGRKIELAFLLFVILAGGHADASIPKYSKQIHERFCKRSHLFRIISYYVRSSENPGILP